MPMWPSVSSILLMMMVPSVIPVGVSVFSSMFYFIMVGVLLLVGLTGFLVVLVYCFGESAWCD